MFESRNEELAPRTHFLRRQLLLIAAGAAALAVSLALGAAGYHWIAGLRWVDAILNASMILGGMGPVDPLPSDAAKLFASAYALFSGVIFVSSMAVMLSPALHRALHKFHLERGARED